mmetsp:Transcript_30875/g.77515  ORF Transcript_30875/g.77515 Transcript_30875/m.77515 type:complete len:227 (+) Transcript_30875:335-1015(+)|eukprot:CAMPEP_0177636754 /NCGR_PEP_ID=MMETSP0447-20121125/4605_1 /TAXON_ID=0 /ORGANISM="Stygamoeba regulata, Strain BSH-02190019" /LENGTH=226 /DNA_ID=CAMNT_0019138633 /DNA_START=255 /DNA_END=935 /DNA_ORIENTATION=-
MSRVNDEVAAMPLQVLFAKPLENCVDAQTSASDTMLNFIKKVGFGLKEGDDWSKNPKPITFSFDLYRTGSIMGIPESFSVKVPLIAMVPIPVIRIDSLEVQFLARITSQHYGSQARNSANVNTSDYDGKVLDATAAIITKSDTHSSYDVHRNMTLKVTMRAVQAEAPRGLLRVLDILESTIHEDDMGQKTNQLIDKFVDWKAIGGGASQLQKTVAGSGPAADDDVM